MTEQTSVFQKCFAYERAKQAKAAGLYPFFRPIEATSGANVVTHGKRRVMIGSNNYLGLTHHPRVQEAAKRAIELFGTGCTGSRLLNGNLKIHEELETKLAAFLKKEDCLVYSTGFHANQGTLSCLIGKKDAVYSDQENHASIVEGCRSGAGTIIKFKHNDMKDLDRVLTESRSSFEGALIVADGVFSMSGDIIDLPKLVEVARKHKAQLYIDDAHSLGVLGPNGQGTEFHYDMVGSSDIVMGTFSKSFASVGGFVAGERDVIDYIRHNSRSFMFSASLPPAGVATVLECLNVIEEEPEHLKNLWRNARKMSRALKDMGFNTLGSQTPIIPIFIGDDYKAYAFSQKLYECGIFATAVAAPAVPPGLAAIRTSYMATHTDDDLNYVLNVLDKLGVQFGLIGKKNYEQQERYEMARSRLHGMQAAV